MSNLKKVVAEKCVTMMSIGLKWRPTHRDDTEFRTMLGVYYKALVKAGYTDNDALRVSKAWDNLIGREREWFYAADLLIEIRATQNHQRQAALMDMSDDQRLANLKRLGGMMKIAFTNTGSR